MKKILVFLLFCGFSWQIAAADFKVGDRVQCNWQKKGTMYSGKITSLSGGNVHISYDDGDQEDTTLNLCKAIPAPKVGDRVECDWKNQGTFYPGKITSKKGDSVHISYDDGGQEDTTINMCKKSTGTANNNSNSNSSGNCHFNGKQLWGKVQFVSSFPDVKAQVVTSFPDLKVQMVNSFPDSCGKWQETSSFPDLKVQIVDSFPDIKIQYVDSFPGK